MNIFKSQMLHMEKKVEIHKQFAILCSLLDKHDWITKALQCQLHSKNLSQSLRHENSSLTSDMLQVLVFLLILFTSVSRGGKKESVKQTNHPKALKA